MDFERSRFLADELCPSCGGRLAVTEQGWVVPTGRILWTEVEKVCQGTCGASLPVQQD